MLFAGLLCGKIPNDPDLELLALQRGNRSHDPKAEPDAPHNPDKAQDEVGCSVRIRQHQNAQNHADQKCKDIEDKRLPGVEAYIRALVVAWDDQEVQRWNERYVRQRGDCVFRDARLTGFSHDSSFRSWLGLPKGLLHD